MKTVSFKTYTLLLIALGILSGCKMMGDFAIVKRIHNKGYYIQTPSFINNANSKTAFHKKNIHPVTPIKPMLIADNEMLLASINTMPIKETNREIFQMFHPLGQGQKTSENTFNTRVSGKANFQLLFPQFPINSIARDTIHKKKGSENKNNTYKNIPRKDKKMDWAALLAIIFFLFTILIIIFIMAVDDGYLTTMSNWLFMHIILWALVFPLTGIILGYVGLRRIDMNRDKLKGKGLAIIDTIIGYILFFYLLLLYVIFYMGQF